VRLNFLNHGLLFAELCLSVLFWWRERRIVIQRGRMVMRRGKEMFFDLLFACFINVRREKEEVRR
jgi:hypothetical protein